MMKVISPFGPKIAKLKFSSQLINKINFEVDKINSNILLAKKLDYSKKLINLQKNLKQNFGILNLQKRFIITYHQT